MIPYEKGVHDLLDTNALLHTVMDMLLGVVTMGDIGKYFPDVYPAYKGII